MANSIVSKIPGYFVFFFIVLLTGFLTGFTAPAELLLFAFILEVVVSFFFKEACLTGLVVILGFLTEVAFELSLLKAKSFSKTFFLTCFSGLTTFFDFEVIFPVAISSFFDAAFLFF